MNVGRNAARLSVSVLTSAQCPSVARAITAPTSTMRPNTCASGRNSSVLASSPASPLNIGARYSTALPTEANRFRWVSTTPLGRPVVPEV